MTDCRLFKVGVIGLGFGAAVHVPGFRAVPGAEVVAIAGRSPERARAAAERSGIPGWDSSADALLERDLDAVSVALPPSAARPILEKALARGLAVLAEKPLAADLAAAARLAAHARGRTTAVDFQLPDLKSFSACKAFVDSGRFGRLRRVHLIWLSWSYALANAEPSWKLDAKDGGALNLFGSHALHMVEHLFGPLHALSARLDDARTRAAVRAGAAPAEDTIELTGDFASGARFTALISNAAPGGPAHRWIAVFDGGTVVVESTAAAHLDGFRFAATDPRGKPVERVDEPAADGDARIVPFARLAARFVAAARTGTPATPDFGDGLQVQRLMARVRESHAAGGASLPIAEET